MNILTLSPSRLEKAACLRRYWMYAILGRKSAAPRAGADAGHCVHKGFAVLNQNLPPEEQDAAIKTARQAKPLQMEDDYRTEPFLIDAMAQLRAELAPVTTNWKYLEVEQRGFRKLGEVALGPTTVQIEYVRDCVIQAGGDKSDIWVVDLKTSSRDDQADVAAFENSGQFKCYAWAWNDEHPDQPCRGVQPIRLIMRKPSRTGIPYTVKVEKPVRFDSEILEEWKAMTLRRAADIASRDPDNPIDWPMTDSAAGLCRNQWGCCEYLSVCTLPISNRRNKLATDAFMGTEEGRD